MPVLPEVGSMISMPGFRRPGLLRIPDHGRPDAVFHRIGRVPALDLGKHRRLRAHDAVQLDQRRFAYRLTVILVSAI